MTREMILSHSSVFVGPLQEYWAVGYNNIEPAQDPDLIASI